MKNTGNSNSKTNSSSKRKSINLNIELESSQEKMNPITKFHNPQDPNVYASTQSIELYINFNFSGYDSVIFKKDNISVGKKGIKMLNTGEIIMVVNPKDFEIQNNIGHGASGTVYKAIYTPSKIPVAIKSINIYDKSKRKQFKNDLKVLCSSVNKNLVQFYGAFFEEGSVKLVLEYMDLGSLDKIITKIKLSGEKVPEYALRIITKNILDGLYHLHKNHQIHRDLKPGNILINSKGIIKLTDFGIIKTLENSLQVCTSFVGTKSYMSLERILGKEYSYSSDIWSLGLIVYELATGVFPYVFSKIYLEHVDVISEQDEPNLPDNGEFSEDLQDFIKRCLKKNPDERFSVFELLDHPWIITENQQDYNLVSWLDTLFNKMETD